MSARVFVVGSINLSAHLRLDTLPLENHSSYQPGRLELSASGVGYNLARALQTLGSDVHFGSIVGPDTVGALLRQELGRTQLDSSLIHTGERSARALVLSNAAGERHVHTDLAGTQDSVYPLELFDEGLAACDLSILSNIAYSRPLLERALGAGVPISTDLHAIGGLDNPYDEAFLAASSLLFLSAKALSDPATTVKELRRRFDPEIIVVGLGAEGALLSERARPLRHSPAFPAGRVVSTVGAGDALHAAFCHFWLKGEAPAAALRLACVFAALKIGAASGAQGFTPEADVRRHASQMKP